jgi:small subunit ribosomal protein S23
MENTPGMTKAKAYDITRREFYKLRQQEDIERRIALEEARMVGAYFGKSDIQVGADLEARAYEHWKSWASGEILKKATEHGTDMTNVGADLAAEPIDLVPEVAA